jgi:hypothetical protein
MSISVKIRSLCGDEIIGIDRSMSVGDLIDYVSDKFGIEAHRQLLSISEDYDGAGYEFVQENVPVMDNNSTESSANETEEDEKMDGAEWTLEKKQKVKKIFLNHPFEKPNTGQI